ncbi:MAG: VCBS repeat-containing protein [Nitrospirae bacterium]|nr:VCBS repeat-containing protein [Magnetococcales bacterium]
MADPVVEPKGENVTRQNQAPAANQGDGVGPSSQSPASPTTNGPATSDGDPPTEEVDGGSNAGETLPGETTPDPMAADGQSAGMNRYFGPVGGENVLARPTAGNDQLGAPMDFGNTTPATTVENGRPFGAADFGTATTPFDLGGFFGTSNPFSSDSRLNLSFSSEMQTPFDSPSASPSPFGIGNTAFSNGTITPSVFGVFGPGTSPVHDVIASMASKSVYAIPSPDIAQSSFRQAGLQGRIDTDPHSSTVFPSPSPANGSSASTSPTPPTSGGKNEIGGGPVPRATESLPTLPNTLDSSIPAQNTDPDTRALMIPTGNGPMPIQESAFIPPILNESRDQATAVASRDEIHDLDFGRIRGIDAVLPLEIPSENLDDAVQLGRFAAHVPDFNTAVATAGIHLHSDPVAHRPWLMVDQAIGFEDRPIRLPIESSLSDAGGSETLSLVIAGVPEGAALSAGTDLGSGQWRLGVHELDGLTLMPPQDSDADFRLAITATSTHGTDSATATDFINVVIEPMADLPILTVHHSSGIEDVSIPLDVSVSLTDWDGSEMLSIQIGDLPEGARLSAGRESGDGLWTLTAADLDGLRFLPPPHFKGALSLSVVARAVDGIDQAMDTAQVEIDLSARADTPLIERIPATPDDSGSWLHFIVTPQDMSESLTFQLSGVPTGSHLSAGIEREPGTWDLTLADLGTLHLSPPVTLDNPVSLVLSATTDDRGDQATTTATLDFFPKIPVIFGETQDRFDPSGGRFLMFGSAVTASMRFEGKTEAGDAFVFGGGATEITLSDMGNLLTILQRDGDPLSSDPLTLKILGGTGSDAIGFQSGEGSRENLTQAVWLEGGAGDDWLTAVGGHDVLSGGPGNDRLSGGSGNDLFWVNVGNILNTDDFGIDWIVADAGAGSDTLVLRVLPPPNLSELELLEFFSLIRTDADEDGDADDLVLVHEGNDRIYGSDDDRGSVQIENFFNLESPATLQTLHVDLDGDLEMDLGEYLLDLTASDGAVSQLLNDAGAVLGLEWAGLKGLDADEITRSFVRSTERFENRPGDAVESLTGDFNNDGSVDLYVAYRSDPHADITGNWLWLNDGTGHFIKTPSPTIHPIKDLIDYDGDGDLDLIHPNGISINDGSGNFSLDVTFPTVPNINRISLADFDGDSDLDAFLGAGQGWLTGGAAPDTLLINQDGQYILSGLSLGNANTTAIGVADIDDDGDLDVVPAYDTRSGGNCYAYINDGSGDFSLLSIPLYDGVGGGFALVDVDLDGDSDILRTYSREFRVYLNDGHGLFSEGQGLTLSQGGAALRLDVDDLDNDGDLDVVVGLDGDSIVIAVNGGDPYLGYEYRSNLVLYNKGDGTFEKDPELPMGNKYTSNVHIVDLDDDGYKDLFFVNRIPYKSSLNGTDAINDIYLNVPYLLGSDGDDLIIGGDGSELLVGMGGRDLLMGGAGMDFFRFQDPLHATTSVSMADLIIDFTPGSDRIELSTKRFGGDTAASNVSKDGIEDLFVQFESGKNYFEFQFHAPDRDFLDQALADGTFDTMAVIGYGSSAVPSGIVGAKPYVIVLDFIDTEGGEDSATYLLYDRNPTVPGVTVLSQLQGVDSRDLSILDFARSGMNPILDPTQIATNDRVTGSRWDDDYYGGSGNDSFVLQLNGSLARPGFGHDRIVAAPSETGSDTLTMQFGAISDPVDIDALNWFTLRRGDGAGRSGGNDLILVHEGLDRIAGTGDDEDNMVVEDFFSNATAHPLSWLHVDLNRNALVDNSDFKADLANPHGAVRTLLLEAGDEVGLEWANLLAPQQIGALNRTLVRSPETLGGQSTETEKVLVGDFNGDGTLDLYLNHAIREGFSEGGGTEIWFNDGDGSTFSRGDSSPPVAIATADIDGDGDADLAGIDGFWVNDGLGHFTTGESWTPITFVSSMDFSDLNNDGILDLFFTRYQRTVSFDRSYSGNIPVLSMGSIDDLGNYHLTNSNNNFPGTIPAPDVGFFDVDGDGDIDIIPGRATFASDNNSYHYINDGNGIFTVAQKGVNYIQTAFAMGDFDGDGDQDVAGSTNNNLYVYSDTLTGFRNQSNLSFTNTVDCIVTLDIDKDGTDELFLLQKEDRMFDFSNSDAALSIRSNTLLPLGNRYTSDVGVGDFDGDGFQDLFLANDRTDLAFAGDDLFLNAGNRLGGTGRDLILGGDGPDLLQGMAGQDLIIGGEGRDVLRFSSPSTGTTDVNLADLVVDFSPAQDRIELLRTGFPFQESWIIHGVNYFETSLTGSGVSDLSHALGDGTVDSLAALGYGTAEEPHGARAGSSVLIALRYDDLDGGFASGTYLLHDNDVATHGMTVLARLQDVTLDGLSQSHFSFVAEPPAVSPEGTLGDDLLVGTGKGEFLAGLSGNDQLQGNGGSDRLYGGHGSDLYRYLTPSDGGMTVAESDFIADFEPGKDRIALHSGGFAGIGTFQGETEGWFTPESDFFTLSWSGESGLALDQALANGTIEGMVAVDDNTPFLTLLAFNDSVGGEDSTTCLLYDNDNDGSDGMTVLARFDDFNVSVPSVDDLAVFI